MNYIKIEKDIFMRDKYNVRRREWLAGQLVPSYVYHSVLRTNSVVNAEDLPEPYNPQIATPSLHSKVMETKVLPEPEVAEEEVEEAKEAIVKKPQPKSKKKAKK